MIVNNWYAACAADELGAEPQRVRMLGCDFVLFRDAKGGAHCLSDVCCHRGASLSGGTLANGRLTCPQHGWEFGTDGRCRRIPSGIKDPENPPKRARVPAYPVEEKFGLVFAFLGDADASARPTIPDILPEFDDTDAWHRGMIKRVKDINYVRLCENYNDPCHVHYVHEFGRWLPKGVTINTHELSEHYVKAFHAAWDADGNWNDEVGLLMEFSVIGMMSRNTNHQPNYPVQIVLATTTPIDADRTQIFMQLLQPKTGDESAQQHAALMDMTEHQVMDEDYAVLKATRPSLSASPQEELLVESDLTVAQVRKMVRDYGARHGAIDTEALSAMAQTHVRVVPCPEHRSDPTGWVHKTVPLTDQSASADFKVAS